MAGEKELESTEIRKSEFNEAQLKMIRIHELQKTANEAQINRDYLSWFDALTSLYKELVGKLIDADKKSCIKQMNKISIKIEGWKYSPFETYLGLYSMNDNGTYRNLKSELFAFDCRLRELIDKHGYSGREEQDDMF